MREQVGLPKCPRIFIMCYLLFVFCKRKLNAGICGEAAVDRKNNACDEAGSCIVKEEHKTAEKLFGFTETVHGSAAKNLFGSGGGSAVGVEEKGSVLVRYEESGSNSVYSDARISEVNSKPLSKV